MPLINLQQLEASLQDAAKHLMRAAGQDERLSPREFRQKMSSLSGEKRDLAEALYHFIVDIDKQGANHITENDIEAGVKRVISEIFPHYAVSEQVMSGTSQKAVGQIAPKTALHLAFQLYQTALSGTVLDAAQVFAYVKSYQDGLFFDYLGSESSEAIEAIHIPCNISNLTAESFAEALGLDQNNPEEVVERFREANSFFPIFVHQHWNADLGEQAQALVDVLTQNLRQHAMAVVGADNRTVDSRHPVYVVGLASDGSLLGFKSYVVWT